MSPPPRSRLTKAELLGLVRDMRAAMVAGSTCDCPTNPKGEHEPKCAWARYTYMLDVSRGVLLG